MNIQTCDVCQRPATFFYSYATCDVSGGQVESPKNCVSLCAEHAALHSRSECQRSLAQLLKTLEKFAQQVKPVQGIQLTITAPDEQSARNVQQAILQLCGGESLVSSPDDVVENLRRAAVELHLEPPFDIRAADTKWEVQWNGDTTISVL